MIQHLYGTNLKKTHSMDNEIGSYIKNSVETSSVSTLCVDRQGYQCV
jgi:hypothetical protein